jgi:parallel beta-helix repeat protein
MDTLPRLFLAARFLLLCFAALLVSGVADAQQVLSVTPTSVTAQAPQGTNASSQTVQVRNAGRAALKWSVMAPTGGWPTWLTVSPTTGVNTGTLTLTFSTSTLPPGQYPTSFVVQSAGAQGSPATVSVQLTISASAPPPLIANCPANKTATSPDNNPVPVTYVIPSPSGGTPPYTTNGVPPSGSNFSVGTTTVQVTAQDSSQPQKTATCSFTVTVTYSPSALIANCPANKTVSSPDGNPVPVTYVIPTPSGGTSPYTTSGSPVSGSNFAVGSTTVQVTAQDSSQPKQTATCSFTVTVTPPSSSGVGPQSTITCPAGAVNIFPGSSIQSAVDGNQGATTFCLKSGIHYVTSSVTPKTGNVFVGEYGAILDGVSWSTTDDSQAAFRVYDDPNNSGDPTGPIDNVTIQNLVIRNMSRSTGINASYTRSAAHWLIDHNEIASNKFGLVFASSATIRNNYIHHNVGNPSSPNPGERGGGYIGQYADNTIVDSNEIASNGPEQKVASSTNVAFRNNFVHHNLRDGIWYDNNLNAAALIDRNRVEDNAGNGIVFEGSIGVTITNNTIRRNGEDGVFISVSQGAQISNNLLEANFGGIEYFLNCPDGIGESDLRDNAAYDNTVVVGTQRYAFASGFNNLSQCTSTELAPYLNGSKNLTFSRNTYHVPSLSFTQYFLWGNGWTGVYNNWNQWQALGSTMTPPQSLQDVGGSIISP